MGGPRRVDNEAKVGTWRRGGGDRKKLAQDERKQRTKKRRKKTIHENPIYIIKTISPKSYF